MPLCKDPLVTHLKKLGLNVVYPPRSSLNPLELMLKQDRKLRRWGETAEAFRSNQKVPQIKSRETVSTIQGEIEATHDLGIGISLLTTIIGQAGAKAIGLKASYKNAKKLMFSYEGVSSDYCDPLAVDKFLNAGALDQSAVSTQEYLESDSLYVVTEVYKSNKLSVTALDDNGSSFEVQVPEIQPLAEANVSIKSDASRQHSLTYEGDTAVTFGIRAMKIDYVSKKGKVFYRLVNASSSISARTADLTHKVGDHSFKTLSSEFDYNFE